MITKVDFSRLNFTCKPSLAQNIEVRYRGKKLTKQQVAILEEVGIGSNNLEIASHLGLAQRTVESHLVLIRKLISDELGYRLGERELVLFARDMLDGYEVFTKLNQDLEDTGVIQEHSKPLLIEDWDEEEKKSEEGYNPLVLPSGHKTFNGVPQPKTQPRSYPLKVFNIEEFKVESKTVVQQDGVFRLV